MIQYCMDVTRAVQKFLLEYEFPTRLNGYCYFKEALVHILKSDIPPSNKTLFMELAEQFMTDEGNIERCLGTLVEKMWPALACVNLFTARPTIREFIMKCAEYITAGTRQRSAYDIFHSPANFKY